MKNDIVFTNTKVETAMFCLRLLEKHNINFLKQAEGLAVGDSLSLLTVQAELDENQVWIEKVSSETYRFILRCYGKLTFTYKSETFKVAE